MKTLYLILVLIGFKIAYTQEVKDTLFFYLDNEYIKQSKYEKEYYYIQDKDNAGVRFFLYLIERKSEIKYKNIQSLKSFIRNSKFYDKNRKGNILDDFDLSNYLENYIIFLVDEKCEIKHFIEVGVGTEIE